jgi:hypothetical protein
MATRLPAADEFDYPLAHNLIQDLGAPRSLEDFNARLEEREAQGWEMLPALREELAACGIIPS